MAFYSSIAKKITIEVSNFDIEGTPVCDIVVTDLTGDMFFGIIYINLKKEADKYGRYVGMFEDADGEQSEIIINPNLITDKLFQQIDNECTHVGVEITES